MAAKLARPVPNDHAEPNSKQDPWSFQENGARNDARGDEDLTERTLSTLTRSSLGKVSSLHGAKAARRHAITELLFFASVGDVKRCKRICEAWKVSVRTLQLDCSHAT